MSPKFRSPSREFGCCIRVHRVLFWLIVCFVYFVCFKVLRLSQLVLFKFRFYCPVNNTLSCRSVTEIKKMVVVVLVVVCGVGKKAVKTQERKRLNADEGQKRFSYCENMLSPDTKDDIHRAFASTHHVNKPMWFRPLQTQLGFSLVYMIPAFHGFLVFLNKVWFLNLIYFSVLLLKTYSNRKKYRKFSRVTCFSLLKSIFWIGVLT